MCFRVYIKDFLDMVTVETERKSTMTRPRFYFILGYYIYAESSWQKTGDKARIASGIVQATAPYSYCYIRFYYHMFGDHIGKLSVKTRQCKTCPEKVWWSRSDSAGNFWVRRAVAMRSDKPFQVGGHFSIFISQMCRFS